MERNQIFILFLFAIIVILVVGISIMVLGPSKIDTVLTMDNSTITEGEYIQITLTDVNGTGLANKLIKINLTSENKHIRTSVETNYNGIASLKLDEGDYGEYTVDMIFEGDDEYNPSNFTGMLTVKEKPKPTPQPQQTSSNNIHYDSELNLYYNDEGICVDPDGKHPMGAGERYEDLVRQTEHEKAIGGR